MIATDAYVPNEQTSNGEADGIEGEDKIKMTKARSNNRAANRDSRLAKAALMCGPGSKICPPDRAANPNFPSSQPQRYAKENFHD